MSSVEQVVSRIRANPDLIPSEDELFDGSSSVEMYLDTGIEFFGHLVKLAGLRPEHRILDIGSGGGRMALPLTHYLTTGGYEGIDPVSSGVDWCNRKIASKHPNFKFQRVDFFNKMYNPTGKVNPDRYSFPYASDEFDVVLLTSVFTHLMPKTVKRYIAEISRVLKPGGKVLCTMFLLNDTSRRHIRETNPERNFPHRMREAHVQFRDTPEGAVAYEEKFFRSLLVRNQLEVVEPIRFGRWSGNPDGFSYQDIVIARRN